MTPEEAKAKYEAEWPALNAAKEAATNPDKAKKCRQQLSRLSTACRARFELTKPDPEVSEVESLRQQLAAATDQIAAAVAACKAKDDAFNKLMMLPNKYPGHREIAATGIITEALAATKEQEK